MMHAGRKATGGNPTRGLARYYTVGTKHFPPCVWACESDGGVNVYLFLYSHGATELASTPVSWPVGSAVGDE